jgi:hypothetical protein
MRHGLSHHGATSRHLPEANSQIMLPMRRIIASLCVCWTAYCGAPRSNTLPLAFGMTPAETAAALRFPLTYHSGRRGSEIYIAHGATGIPGFYPVETGIALQYRRGRLTGWKRDWQLNRPWPF